MESKLDRDNGTTRQSNSDQCEPVSLYSVLFEKWGSHSDSLLTPEELAEKQTDYREAKRLEDVEYRRKSRADELERRLNRLKKQLGARYHDCEIDGFKLSENRDEVARQSKVLESIKSFRSSMSERIKSGEGLFLFGPPGTGKDHLMAALLYYAVRNGVLIEWRDGASLAAEFRSVISSSEITEQRVRECLVGADILALSDPIPPVGALTQFTSERLFSIIDERYRLKRATWITTNVSSREEAEQRLGPQIVDRVTDGALCLACNWHSYREDRRWTPTEPA